MISSAYSNMNDTLLRKIEGKVGLYNGSTLLDTFLPSDKLQEISIARVGEKGKFFGFGICQQATVKIVDNSGDLVFLKGETLKTSFRANGTGDYERICPSFYIKDAIRDEKTSVYTITSYDALDNATSHVSGELGLEPPYTLIDVIEAIKRILGLSGVSYPSGFDIEYETGANLSGEETLRTLLTAAAEVTQTIYYIDHNDYLVFKRLDKDSDPVLTISKNDYFELTKALPVTISKIMSVTELGDNVDSGDDAGVIQYIRDNPFWTNRTDLHTLLPEAIARITGLTIVPYNLRWRGNFLTEVCDKIDIEVKDGSFITTYLLDDSFTYNGGFSQTTDWEYKPEGERATASNPATVGEKLNQTFARVDKVNKQIDLVAQESDENKSALAALQINTNSINASVSKVEKDLADTREDIDGEISSIKQQVDAQITEEEVSIIIKKELENGIDKITTSTGYTFDDEGMRVSKSDSDISTTVSHNGMEVAQGTNEVLVANKDGVRAQDLHATTYLIIGKNSRFEDYGNRTACFWIGGNS